MVAKFQMLLALTAIGSSLVLASALPTLITPEHPASAGVVIKNEQASNINANVGTSNAAAGAQQVSGDKPIVPSDATSDLTQRQRRSPVIITSSQVNNMVANVGSTNNGAGAQKVLHETSSRQLTGPVKVGNQQVSNLQANVGDANAAAGAQAVNADQTTPTPTPGDSGVLTASDSDSDKDDFPALPALPNAVAPVQITNQQSSNINANVGTSNAASGAQQVNGNKGDTLVAPGATLPVAAADGTGSPISADGSQLVTAPVNIGNQQVSNINANVGTSNAAAGAQQVAAADQTSATSTEPSTELSTKDDDSKDDNEPILGMAITA